VSEVFKKSNLDGKQIWYIIAPAAVPLSAVKKISLRDIKSGRKVVSHNGDDYMFTEEVPDLTENTKVMVPNASRGEYRTGKQIVSVMKGNPLNGRSIIFYSPNTPSPANASCKICFSTNGRRSEVRTPATQRIEDAFPSHWIREW
jgi:hypothetical protein